MRVRVCEGVGSAFKIQSGRMEVSKRGGEGSSLVLDPCSLCKYAFQVTRHPFAVFPSWGIYRPSRRAIQPCISLTHRDEPCTQNMDDWGKHRFHELEHESKMRLLHTHSHTSTLQGHEALRDTRRGKGKEPFPCGVRKTPDTEATPHPQRGGGGNVRLETKAQEGSPPPQ